MDGDTALATVGLRWRSCHTDHDASCHGPLQNALRRLLRIFSLHDNITCTQTFQSSAFSAFEVLDDYCAI